MTGHWTRTVVHERLNDAADTALSAAKSWALNFIDGTAVSRSSGVVLTPWLYTSAPGLIGIKARNTIWC